MSEEPIVGLISDDAVQSPAKEIFEKMAEMPGGVPKWMRVMANCPDILGGFFQMFKATMDDAPLEHTFKWKVALLVSKMNECSYCVSVSESKLKSFDLTEEDIAKATESPANKREELAFAYAKAMTEHAYNMDEELITSMQAEFSDAELVELTATIGLFNYINRFNDALNILTI